MLYPLQFYPPSQLPTQTFHLVHVSPWPLVGSLSALTLTSSLVVWFNLEVFPLLLLSLPTIMITMLFWWRDILRETTICGMHTKKVQQGLEWGMILFIASEIMFFSAFFWAFFHSSLAPTFELGCAWPPAGIWPLNPFSIPLLNTAVLLASGVTVTYAHHALIMADNNEMISALVMTVALGAYFTVLQAMEYMDTSFSLADSVYGSTFFVATGFHGLHVLIGSTFLMVCLVRATSIQFSKTHHFGFEAAAWYWHFVDVVWIFLFICMYWWATI